MNLHYKEYGQGEPVIILHGLLGMLDNWHSFAKKLSQDYWVISIDQRNHGKSRHSDQFDYELLAEDLSGFMDQHYIPKAHLIGHSMGGKTVMAFLNQYPDKVDKSIIIDISPKAYSGGHEKIFEALLSLPIDKITQRQQASEMLLKLLPDVGTVNFLLKNLDRTPDNTFKWKANISGLNQNYDHIKSEITFEHEIENPTLFIDAEKSNYITDEDKALIASHFIDYSIETIQGSGHWVHVDKPGILLDRIHSFLRQ